MNSRTKGKVGEREFAALLREHGYEARRGQQFAGGAESPDVVSPALPWLHIEVKRTQALNLRDACAQAEGDCRGKPWVVAHRRNHAPWLITMTAETFFRLLSGEVPPAQDHGAAGPSEKLKAETLKAERGTTGPQDHRTAGPSKKLKTETLKAERGTKGERDDGTTGPQDDGARGATRPTTELNGGRSATRPTLDDVRGEKSEGGSQS